MNAFAQLLQIPPSVFANYMLTSMAGVASTFILLTGAFPCRRRFSPAFYFAYFLAKNSVDAMLWYAIDQGGSSVPFEQMQQLWSGIMGIVSMMVVWLTFEGELPAVALCALSCDLVASISKTVAGALASLLVHGTLAGSYLVEFDPYILLEAAFVLLMVLLLRRPFGWVLAWVCRVTQRFNVVFGVLVSLLFATMIVSVESATVVMEPISNLTVLLACLIVMGVFVVLSLAWRARQARIREAAAREASALAATYDVRVREQLQSLEDELSVLHGHEGTLRNLGSAQGATDLAARSDQLRETYRVLSVGAYCERPALDAVLSVFARRFQDRGVDCSFTVAGIPSGSTVPATIAFALLNLATEVADRAKAAQGDAVELRMRGVGDQVLFRLEVPARWGALWARRLLSAYHDRVDGMVRERTLKGRTVVLVLCEGVKE